jgi:hypothetical protein
VNARGVTRYTLFSINVAGDALTTHCLTQRHGGFFFRPVTVPKSEQKREKCKVCEETVKTVGLPCKTEGCKGFFSERPGASVSETLILFPVSTFAWTRRLRCPVCQQEYEYTDRDLKEETVPSAQEVVCAYKILDRPMPGLRCSGWQAL